VDTDEEHRQILPSAPNLKDFVDWKVSPERHNAYLTLWKYLIYGGLFANTTLWLYF